MIAGHLRNKRGYWHIVLNLKTEDGKRKQKWISTGMRVTGNKKRAEEFLYEKRLEYTRLQDARGKSKGLFFATYMLLWLKGQKEKLSQTSYSSNAYIIKNGIVPFFQDQMIPITELKVFHVESYYQSLLDRGLSPNTVIRHHAIVHKALREAYRTELIAVSIADRIEAPKREVYVTVPYNAHECNCLLEKIRSNKLELVVTIALFTGLRRSEILGLKWKAIDFENNTLHVMHSVHRFVEDGKYRISGQDRLKRNASFRTLPLVGPLRHYLKSIAERRYPNSAPNSEEYLCLDEKGDLIKPNYISKAFRIFLEKHELRHIRFHDLRHSCANLLITARVPLIEVQQWMGHSSLSTTADMYSHLTFDIKLRSAEVLSKQLSLSDERKL